MSTLRRSRASSRTARQDSMAAVSAKSAAVTRCPEFEKTLFRFGVSGILRDLVRRRYGFSIVAVDQSIPSKPLPLEAVRGQIAERLRVSVEERALRQYVSTLAGQAKINGSKFAGRRDAARAMNGAGPCVDNSRVHSPEAWISPPLNSSGRCIVARDQYQDHSGIG